MDVGVVLENALLSVDARVRDEAQNRLKVLSEENFLDYISALSRLIAESGVRKEIRELACLVAKNELTAKDARTKARNQERWKTVSAETRGEVKKASLVALASDDKAVANAAAQLIAAIAEIELPLQGWPELPSLLVDHTRPDQPENIKRASLVAIGYICESADPTNPYVIVQMDGFLTAIIQGAHQNEPSADIRLTAMNALVNSLECIRLNFAKEAERNFIMQVVCEATQSTSTRLQAAAFGALGRIMNLYYQYMRPYMEQALFNLTINGMNNTDEAVSSMAVEFWSTVCEEEIEIHMQELDAAESGIPLPPDSRKSFQFAQIAASQILPILLQLLTRQEEEADEDDWGVAMSAGSCLALFAENTGDAVVPATLAFVSANLNSPLWNYRDAAVMAFGSILTGPNTIQIKGLIREALHPLLALMNDPSAQVKDTVSWCLGRIAEQASDEIDLQNDLPAFIAAIISGLNDHLKVSMNCCWTIMNLSLKMAPEPGAATGPLSQYYSKLMTTLVNCSARPDNEYSARTSAYEALSALVQNSASDCLQLVTELSGVIVQRLQSTLEIQKQIVSMDDRSNLEELQMNLLGLLTSIIRCIGEGVTPAAEQLLSLLLQLMNNRLPNSLIDDDVFLAVGAVASSIGIEFTPYASAFIAFIVPIVKEPETTSSFTAIGLVGDIAQALGGSFVQYADIFMAGFMKILQSSDVQRELKPVVLSCIGDIAASLGEHFVPYLDQIEQMLQVGSQLDVPADAPVDVCDYILTLRISILDAYVGIVSGLRDHPAPMRPYVPQTLSFLKQVSGDPGLTWNEQTTRSAVGLLGDIASMYPNGEFAAAYKEDWMTHAIKRARDRSMGPSTKATARWAREQQKLQMQFT